jgi:uncharacterized membrane protein (DUF485 family)
MDNRITNPIFEGNLANKNGNGISLFQSVIPQVITIGLTIGIIIFLFIMILGAVGWINAGDNKGALENARNRMVSALIGLVVLVSLFAVLAFAQNFTSVPLLSLNISALKVN